MEIMDLASFSSKQYIIAPFQYHIGYNGTLQLLSFLWKIIKIDTKTAKRALSLSFI
jgi:hypothetical protein